MYLLLKALHVTAMAAWIGGTVTLALLTPGADAARATALRRLSGRLVTPAMVVTLLLGVYLAWDGGWYKQGWLHAKLVFVIVLTGLHGVLSGRLRRMAGGAPSPVPAWLPAAALLLLTAIAWLALAKPALR